MRLSLTLAVPLWALACSTVRAGIDLGITESPEVMRVYADAGDPSAQCNLAFLYERGTGVQQNTAEAIQWYRRAAAGGSAQAQFNLGVHLANGDGLAKDDKAAASLFYEAALQGFFEAQRALIACYIEGRGEQKNLLKALTWDFVLRRTLELRYEEPAGAPPKPATLRPDGFAEYTTPDGKREAIGEDGSVEHLNADGTGTVDHRPDGGTTVIGADKIRVTSYPDGRVRTDYPDGTSQVEGDGTKGDEHFRITEKYDKQNHLVSKRVSDGVIVMEDLPDGAHAVESNGEDDHGRKVKVIERFEKDGSEGSRRLVREDGVERSGAETWTVTRWIRGPDGVHIHVREIIGEGGSIQNQEVLEKRPLATPVVPAQAVAAAGQAGPPETADSGTVIHRRAFLATPDSVVALPLPPGYSQAYVVPVINQVDPSPYRSKVPIDSQLADLAKLEREARYFPGLTDAEFEKARAVAAGFIIYLPAIPQKAITSNWLNQRVDALIPPPDPSPLVESLDDRSGVYPFGYNGRDVIKLYPWKHAETDHFVVHYLKASDAYPVMRSIECAFFVVTHTLQIDPARTSFKLHVFVFPDRGSWLKFTASKGLRPEVIGFAYKDELLLGAYEARDMYLKTICHEATHAIVAHFYPGRRWPLWLNEGFADYMGARSVALRGEDQVARYLDAEPTGPTDVTRIFDRVRYGSFGGVQTVGGSSNGTTRIVQASGVSEIVQFYASSEKCVRVLLEKLPPGQFPTFANFAFAGNAIPACLGATYSTACPDAAKFQALFDSVH